MGQPDEQATFTPIRELFSEQDLRRLATGIETSRLMLEQPRRNMHKLVLEYAGGNYSSNGPVKDVPVNFISQYVNIVVRNLIAQNPRVNLNTFDKSMKPMVAAMQKSINKAIEKMYLKETLQRGAFNALFSLAIAKVALASPPEAANYGFAQAAGEAFVELIELDDFVFDPRARKFEQARWIGHRIRVPLAAVRADHRYDRSAVAKLKPSIDQPYNAQGDEKLNRISQGYNGDPEDFDDMVDLWEIWIPSRKIIVTVADDALQGTMNDVGKQVPLLVQDWVGPDCGPYHILSLATVPGNAMPKAPLMDLEPLHTMANEIWRKLRRQCARMKQLLLVPGLAAGDAKAVNDASDGDTVKCDNADKLQNVKMGGPDQVLFQFFQALQIIFSWFAGNLDSLGGLSPQAKTLGQDEMLQKNSSKGIADYQDRVVAWTASILDGLCWYWYHDPHKVMTSNFEVPNMAEYSTVKQVTPEDRMRGNYEDLDIRVDPYSLQHSTPQSRLGMMNQLVQNIIVPLMPMLQQQGVGLDANAWLDINAKLGDMPDLSSILTFVEPPQQGMQGAGAGDGQPQPGPQPPAASQPPRQVQRLNQPGRTHAGDLMNAMNTAAGRDVGGNPNGGAAA